MHQFQVDCIIIFDGGNMLGENITKTRVYSRFHLELLLLRRIITTQIHSTFLKCILRNRTLDLYWEFKKMVLLRLELRLQDSKSWVLTNYTIKPHIVSIVNNE
ncbi:hypothetical protein ACTA71_009219 [Dictyostelium dimigraforme]